MRPAINLSLAAFAGLSHIEAMATATSAVHFEPAIGALSLAHTQLVPQSRGQLTEDIADGLRQKYPGTQLRLHANVQVLAGRTILDLSRWGDHRPYWQQLARVSQILGAPAYTAHAGRRTESSLDTVLEATRAAEDLFGCPVGVEGHYPTATNDFHVSTWAEYQAVMESGVKYVVDLSHLHIVATRERRFDLDLAKAMVADPNCIEVHVSANDGRKDQHRTLVSAPWWWPALHHIHAGATVFSEGAQASTSTVPARHH